MRSDQCHRMCHPKFMNLEHPCRQTLTSSTLRFDQVIGHPVHSSGLLSNFLHDLDQQQTPPGPHQIDCPLSIISKTALGQQAPTKEVTQHAYKTSNLVPLWKISEFQLASGLVLEPDHELRDSPALGCLGQEHEQELGVPLSRASAKRPTSEVLALAGCPKCIVCI